MVYAADPAPTGCAPLSLISHGAGGAETEYHYLANFMASQGYTAIVMGHVESGLQALVSDWKTSGFPAGVKALVADPTAEKMRLLDIAAALKWADAQCHATFRVLLGHSMGAETVMLEAGATNIIGLSDPPARQDRFNAYVALSPEGPGIVFGDHAWTGIRKPMLILTGTRDQAFNGSPETRQIPFRELPGIAAHCQWLGVIENATHMNFAGAGLDAERVKPQITGTIAAFLRGVRSASCTLPAQAAGLQLNAK